MPRWVSRGFVPLLALSLFAIAALLAAACSDDGTSREAQNAGVINAINILDNAGLHGIDDSINKDKTIPATAKTTADKMQAVVKLTEWPDELQSKADALAKIFADFSAALDGEKPDLAKAGELSTKAHDAEHDFSHEVWDHLYEESGVKVAAEAEGH